MKYIFNESKHKINQSNTKFMVLIGTFVDTPMLGELRIRKNCCLGVDLRSVDDRDGEFTGKMGKIVFIKENSSNVNDPILDAYEYDSSLQKLDIDSIKIIETNKKTEGDCQFYFPGFIDTHCHASQYPNAGIFGNTTLLDWLNKYTFPLEQSLVDLKIAHQVYGKVLQKTISHGTTCVAYYATLDSKSTILLAEVCKQYGQRAFIGKVCMDRNSPDFYKETMEESIQSVHEVLKYIKNMNDKERLVGNGNGNGNGNTKTTNCGNIDKIQPILTPRFAPACTDGLMKYLGDLSLKENLLIQTHLSENLNEIEWVENLYPELPNYTSVYDHFNLLHERTILAHCIHLSESEIEMIKKRKSKVSHCPISNTSITSGECKVRTLLDNGIDVSLGTDLSGGYSSSILHTAKHAVLVSRHVAMKADVKKSKKNAKDNKENDKTRNHYKLSTKEALYLGTMGGAKCLGLDKIIGSFEVGKEFDCQMIDLNVEDSNVDVFTWQYYKPPTVDAMQANNHKSHNEEKYEKAFTDLIDKWLYNGDDRNTVKVWIQGLLVKTNS